MALDSADKDEQKASIFSKEPVYIKVDHKSSIMHQIEQNLQEIELIQKVTVDQDKAKEESMLAREVFALNEKLEKKKITKDDQSGLLEQLDLKDRLVLKKSFCK